MREVLGRPENRDWVEFGLLAGFGICARLRLRTALRRQSWHGGSFMRHNGV
eukprot:CAMPEP_0204390168 /NCGR_PEP_ID=MMETSP0469-20131031/60539_1 /ASSEMBLY_ACC=CAM_ASM_000384 /TAXON_ID=2969 /ORGANISM="Oxyrrhis marina" /LENGTH=50 /DNA_ID=CAMNT_0051383979 /DNA_START=59 /DNA_END=211 /DNA_ORIENTATION=-